MFQPVLISRGFAGWQFLKATYDRQLTAFNSSPQIQGNTNYFAERIGSISTAEELVSDRRLLSVALGAFGLENDIENRFFIQRILEEGTTASDALANRFTDSRYSDLSEAFGFGPGEVRRTLNPGFADTIVARYQAASFETAAGAQDQSMRLGLYTERILPDVVRADVSTDAKWFSIMGQPPLREVLETALDLPDGFGQIDIDQQLEVFKARSEGVFGVLDPSDFSLPEILDDLITTYLAQNQLEGFGPSVSSGQIALTLLSS